MSLTEEPMETTDSAMDDGLLIPDKLSVSLADFIDRGICLPFGEASDCERLDSLLVALYNTSVDGERVGRLKVISVGFGDCNM